MIKKASEQDMDLYFDEANGIYEFFNRSSGYYERHTYDRDTFMETEQDAFMRGFPGLIDIGIMGFCKNAPFCKIGCYQGGKTKGTHMSLSDYNIIMQQCQNKVMQVALGGAGDPNDHPDFEEILKATVEHDIVPNYTTSGIGVDEKIAALTKQYCGAVAVSLYTQTTRVKIRKKIV